jgi:hypothetical protein
VCSYGTFGPNCDRFCHCKGDTCDQRTGVCPKGCLPGWMGSECDMGKCSILRFRVYGLGSLVSMES